MKNCRSVSALIIALLLTFVLVAVRPPADGNNKAEIAEELVQYSLDNMVNTVRVKLDMLGESDFIKMYGTVPGGKPAYENNKFYDDTKGLMGLPHEECKCTGKTYFSNLAEFAQSYNISDITFSKRSEPYKQPEFKPGELEVQFYNVVVTKTWETAEKKMKTEVTYQVDVWNKLIPTISGHVIQGKDGVSPHRIDNNTENRDIRTSIDDSESEYSLMAAAALMYDRKMYDDAAALFREVTKKYPNNGEAWYKLGVMYYKNQGLGKLSRKQRLQGAYDCWKQSDIKAAERAISYITDGRE